MAVVATARAQVFSLAHFKSWCAENELTLDSGEPWETEEFQDELLADVFAGFREIWAILPEGNAKTTLMAGVALYCLDHAQQPWIPIGASARDQAEILFGQGGGFVERSDSLKKRMRVYEGYRRIKSLTNGGRGIRVYPWDPRTGDGVIPFPIAFVDELHRHADLRLYRLWKGKLGKRGAQIVAISTAGEPGSEFEEQRERIRNLARERTRDGCHLRAEGANLVYHEWMVPTVEKARDLEVVKDANPLRSITPDYLAEKLGSETLDFGEDWLRLTCNIPARSSRAAVPEADWDACETDEEIPEGVPVACGADFAWLHDTTAIVPLWVRDPEFRLFGDPEILVPPRDGTILDVEDVKEAFLRIHSRNPIEFVVVDRTKAEDTMAWLENDLGVTVVDRPQGSTDLWALDYERWMVAVRKRWIRHTGHPVFRQHVLNAIARRLPGDRYRFDRPSTSRNSTAGRQERRVIDALTAASMVHTSAVSRFAAPTEPEPMVAYA